MNEDDITLLQENVSERLKRLGANLPFSLWIKEEVEQMQKILDEFRSALLVRLTVRISTPCMFCCNF